jgi:hypothetical protein
LYLARGKGRWGSGVKQEVELQGRHIPAGWMLLLLLLVASGERKKSKKKIFLEKVEKVESRK